MDGNTFEFHSQENYWPTKPNLSFFSEINRTLASRLESVPKKIVVFEKLLNKYVDVVININLWNLVQKQLPYLCTIRLGMSNNETIIVFGPDFTNGSSVSSSLYHFEIR